MAHSYTGIYYHLIFRTKSKDNLIPKGLFEELFAYMGGVIRNMAAFFTKQEVCRIMCIYF